MHFRVGRRREFLILFRRIQCYYRSPTQDTTDRQPDRGVLLCGSRFCCARAQDLTTCECALPPNRVSVRSSCREQICMPMRVSCLVSCLLISGLGFAQSSASATPMRSSIQERLIYSSHERLQWEAAQMWNAPPVPAATEPAHHSIHLQQPPLTPPRIRREWLRPSPEAETPETNPDLTDMVGSSSYLQKKTR